MRKSVEFALKMVGFWGISASGKILPAHLTAESHVLDISGQ
jgi:hypothetical protein